MKDRMTLGHIADVAESAALTMADGRATGSLRIALGERCFRVPPYRRHSFGSPSNVWSARDRLRDQRPQSPKCRAALRASRATPLAHYKLRSL